MKNANRYSKMPGVHLSERDWPSKEITKAPIWCSVDLRDGNQALEIPMNLEQKLNYFNFLVDIGFKTIEIGFPAASDTEFEFCRYLIDNDMIPDDVAIQVLTQSREHIIAKTIEALRGAPKAVVHLYNSTSTLQREVVFRFGKTECIELAVSGAKMIMEAVEKDDSRTEWFFEYSPESFSGTEPDFAVEICDHVLDVWQPTSAKKAIINLPGTVEMSTPNVFADQVEYFCKNTKWRDQIIVSIHPHNDRGTAVAATELGLMAGADRVEGTLFGNGERTGNADIVTIAMNMYMHGIDPGLDFSDMNRVIEAYEEATNLEVHIRHPWAGKLVFTAFSGSHQDAINKGMKAMQAHPDHWEVPYLPIDPMDVGRSYDPIIRINSQSGKGGVSYILENQFGLHLPKPFQKAVGALCTSVSDQMQCELNGKQIFDLFDDKFVNIKYPYELAGYKEESLSESHVNVYVTLLKNGNKIEIQGSGNGLLDAFCDGFYKHTGEKVSITMYNEHAMKSGSDSAAITYVEIEDVNKQKHLGAGISSSVTKSSLRAVISSINMMIQNRGINI
ncbi:MAG: 2-isopropylmalate synthase [Clostridiaceae bacterium]|nr:2-isopropylmalate synthase [Clostridiaceae bacterium]